MIEVTVLCAFGRFASSLGKSPRSIDRILAFLVVGTLFAWDVGASVRRGNRPNNRHRKIH